jgi:tetratricopeptide (TPR) repeat protein
MTTSQGGSGRKEDPTTQLQRKIEDLLARGNAAEREDRIDGEKGAQAPCAEVMTLLQRCRAEELFDEEYRREVWSRATLLCANIAAHTSTALTPELHEAYGTAIAAARAVRVGGTHEGRAHRAYGAVLAYYGQLEEATAHLGQALQALARADREVTDPRFFEPEPWVLTGVQLAEVLVQRGMEEKAIEILRQVTRLFAAEQIAPNFKTTHANDLEAGTLLAVLLWRGGITKDATTWRKRVIARALELDPTGKDPHYACVWELKKRGFRRYSRRLTASPRRLRI